MSDLFHHKEAKPLDVEISESDTSSDSANRSDGDSASDSASDRRDSASDGDSASDSDSDTAQVAQAASNWGQLYTPSPENNGADDHEGGFLDNSLVGLSFQPQPTPNLDNAIVSTQNHPRYSPKVIKSIHL